MGRTTCRSESLEPKLCEKESGRKWDMRDGPGQISERDVNPAKWLQHSLGVFRLYLWEHWGSLMVPWIKSKIDQTRRLSVSKLLPLLYLVFHLGKKNVLQLKISIVTIVLAMRSLCRVLSRG